jgi:hypothetical protein
MVGESLLLNGKAERFPGAPAHNNTAPIAAIPVQIVATSVDLMHSVINP